MAVYAGPEISNDNLILSFDAANIKSYDRYENIITDSEFSYAQQSGSTVATGSQLFVPYGRNTAVNFNNNGGAGDTYIYRNFGTTLSSGTKYVISVFSNSSTLVLGQGGLAAGNYTQISSGSVFISNGWYRHWVSYSATVNNPNITPQVVVAQGINVTLCGWQVEVGAVITEYYQTGASAKSRGTTLTDLSGRGYTGTLTNGPTYSGSNGGFISCDGTNDYIATGLVLPSPSTTPTTFDLVFKNNSSSTFKGLIGASNYQVSGFSIGLQGQSSITMTYNAAGLAFENPWTYDSSVISNGVFVFNGRSISAYRNGSLISTYSPSFDVVANAGGIGIGINYQGGWGYAQCDIYSVKVYNRALTASEVQQNFNATRGRFSI